MLEQINKENFQHLLGQFNTTELESMIEKFPYFQQAHLLLAKKYQLENSPKFDQQLQLAALYIQDRELLYTLFNEKTNAVSKPTLTIETPKVETIEEVPLPITERIAEPAKEDEVKTATTTVEVVDNAPTEADLMLELEQIEKSARELGQFSKEGEAETNADVVLEKNEPLIELPNDEPVLAVAEEEIVIAPAVTESIEENVSVEPEETVEEEIIQTEEKPAEVFSRIEPHTFDEWLKAFNNKKSSLPETPVVANDKADEDDELNKLLAVNISVDYLHGIVKEETTYAKGLEKFIEEQIQKHKQPEIKKAPDFEPSDEPATETMAKVFEMQKKYAKAIKTYEALISKVPAKSSFFVARINYLKKIM